MMTEKYTDTVSEKCGQTELQTTQWQKVTDSELRTENFRIALSPVYKN